MVTEPRQLLTMKTAAFRPFINYNYLYAKDQAILLSPIEKSILCFQTHLARRFISGLMRRQ